MRIRVFNKFCQDILELHNSRVLENDTQNYIDKMAVLPHEEVAKQSKDYTELYLALDKLSKRQREVVEKSVVLGWNATEIGEDMGMSSATVRVHLKRGLDKLKTLMGAD